MATDQYRTLHQFYTHEETHTSGQHSGNGPEEHNKSTTPKLPQHEKQLRLSTMASTLGTHKKLRTISFILGNEQYTSTAQGKLMTPKRATGKSDRFFGVARIMKWTDSTHNNQSQTENSATIQTIAPVFRQRQFEGQLCHATTTPTSYLHSTEIPKNKRAPSLHSISRIRSHKRNQSLQIHQPLI